MRNVQARAYEPESESVTAVAPGRRTRTERLSARPSAAVQLRAVEAAPTPRAHADLDLAFDFTSDLVQRQAVGAPQAVDVPAVAAQGVAQAAAPLPHGDVIQRAFGRHDVGHVRAQVGGAATAASDAIGATAYATGDRVAFAAAPDLHLAAHEAAHVVQQRAGVHLAGGVGAAGDRYEQHADRVADLVVAGRSAEAALDELAGVGSAGAAVQRHDSPSHVRAGDSVPGSSMTFRQGDQSVTFTPGELNALVDFVGDLNNLRGYTFEQLQGMKQLLVDRCEDVAQWDTVTGGKYSVEAQDNEKHFAPAAGDGGMNFRDQFIAFYGDAIDLAKTTRSNGDTRARAQLAAYTAEHYLEDAFSAGHQLAAKDVETAVAQHIGWLNSRNNAARIGREVWSRKQDAIRCYEYLSTLGWAVFDQDTFVQIATLGALAKGAGGMVDAIRRYVHEQLGASGVWVTSMAHPTPWQLRGDHGLGDDAEGKLAMQAALADARGRLKDVQPGDDGKTVATSLYNLHCPVPTAEGRGQVDGAINDATKDTETIIAAVIDSMSDTIEEIMDYLAVSAPVISLTIRKVKDVPNPPHDYPDMPDYEGPIGGGPAEDPGTPAPTPQPISGQPVGGSGGSLPSTGGVTGQPVGGSGGSLPSTGGVTGQPVGGSGGSLPSTGGVYGQPVGESDSWLP